MSLHPPVLFIGDRPNPKKNLSMDVPFVGTKSYKTLLEWIYRMDLEIKNIEICNAYKENGAENTRLEDILDLYEYDLKIIALGMAASERVVGFNAGLLAPIQFFKLPHPSGLNRNLNDKKKLSELLAKCREFVYKQD